MAAPTKYSDELRERATRKLCVADLTYIRTYSGWWTPARPRTSPSGRRRQRRRRPWLDDANQEPVLLGQFDVPEDYRPPLTALQVAPNQAVTPGPLNVAQAGAPGRQTSSLSREVHRGVMSRSAHDRGRAFATWLDGTGGQAGWPDVHLALVVETSTRVTDEELGWCCVPGPLAPGASTCRRPGRGRPLPSRTWGG